MARITITLPVFNAMPYLEAAVQSILAQSYGDFVFAIVDDGSTDESPRYLQSIRDSRVQVCSQQNAGLGATLNRLIAMCETELFARMDADDVADSDKIRRQIVFLDAHPEVVMVGTQVRFLVGGGVCRFSAAPVDHASIVNRLLHGKAGVSHPTLVLRTAAVRDAGGYRVGGVGEDLDFCLRMCEQGGAANLPDELYSYRIHDSSIVTRRRHDIHCGYAYAIRCAECRRTSIDEPTFDEFRSSWEKRSWIDRWVENVDDYAESHYRRGIVALSAGVSLAGWGHLAATSLLRPRSAINRAAALFRRRVRESTK